jgi:hypothetical protein
MRVNLASTSIYTELKTGRSLNAGGFPKNFLLGRNAKTATA